MAENPEYFARKSGIPSMPEFTKNIITNTVNNQFFTVVHNGEIFKVYLKIFAKSDANINDHDDIIMHKGKKYMLYMEKMDISDADKADIIQKLDWSAEIKRPFQSHLNSDIALKKSVISPMTNDKRANLDRSKIELEQKNYSVLQETINDKLKREYEKDSRSKNDKNDKNGTSLYEKNMTPMIKLLMVLYKGANLTPQLSSIRDNLIVPSEYNNVTKMYKALTTLPISSLNIVHIHKSILSFILFQIESKNNKYVKANTNPYIMMDAYIKMIGNDSQQQGGKSKKHHIRHKQRKLKTRKQRNHS